MPPILHDFLLIFVPLFVVVDPAGTIPIFLALTASHTDEQRRRIAMRAAGVASVTGILFVVLGQAILSFLGLRFEDFQIAGGILLVVLAIMDLLVPGKAIKQNTPLDPESLESVGIVPLAVPLIVGPATMTTSLLLVNTYSKNYVKDLGASRAVAFVSVLVCIAFLLNILMLLLAMLYSHRLVAIVGRNTMAVVNKIVMILLAAIAVSLIRQGIQGIMSTPIP